MYSYSVISGVHDVICTTFMLWSVACITSYVQQLCCGQWRASRHMYNGYAVASGVHDIIYIQQLCCCQWRALCNMYNSYVEASSVHGVKSRVMLWSVACMTSNVELCCDKQRMWKNICLSLGDNIKMTATEIGWESVDWINLAPDKDTCWGLWIRWGKFWFYEILRFLQCLNYY